MAPKIPVESVFLVARVVARTRLTENLSQDEWKPEVWGLTSNRGF